MPPTQSRYVRYAKKGAEFLLVALSENMAKARRLRASAPVTTTDGGEGGDFTIGVSGATSSARGVVKLAGQIGGSADSLDVRGLRATDGTTSTLLTLGDISDGQALVRSGTTVVGAPVVPSTGGAMSGDLDMGGNHVTNLATGSDPADAATYGQLVAMQNGLDWQNPVLDKDLATPPGSPASGARYIVAASPTGAWSGHTDDIAIWSGSAWSFVTPTAGYTVHLDDEGVDYSYNGSAWVSLGVSIDHASLLNLTAGNPHTQYQLGSARDAASGYAGLDSNSQVNKPIKSVRTASDPGSPTPGETWVNGADLKYQDNGGTPTTRVVERQSNKGVAGGYASLDGSAHVVEAPAAHATSHAPGGSDALAVDQVATTASLRTLGSSGTSACAGDDARLSDARTPTAHVSTHLSGTDALPIDAAAGTASLRSLSNTGTTACAGNDSRLSDARTPLLHVSTHLSGADALPIDASAGTASLRSLGTTGAKACAGDDSRLSDTRVPQAHPALFVPVPPKRRGSLTDTSLYRHVAATHALAA